MNTEKKIEQSLRAAPKPPAPDGLLKNLQDNITLEEGKHSDNIIRRFLSPAGGQVSLWRVAAVAAVAAMVLLPLTYAGGKVIKSYFVKVEVTETIENNGSSITKVGTASAKMNEPGYQPNEEEVKEINELKKAGKFEKVLVEERIENGMKFSLYEVNYTLSSGKVITVNEIEGGSI